MLPAYLLGARQHFPEAAITFDKFHVLRLLDAAVDEVRRQEQKERSELKRTRYLWLENPGHLSVTQRQALDELPRPSHMGLATARAYRLKPAFQEFWELPRDVQHRCGQATFGPVGGGGHRHRLSFSFQVRPVLRFRTRVPHADQPRPS